MVTLAVAQVVIAIIAVSTGREKKDKEEVQTKVIGSMTREEDMTTEEAVKYIRCCMCEGRLVGNTMPIIDEKWQAGVMAIKALETLEEFEKAQIITGGRLNGRTYAYKCGLEDGKRKALEQEPVLDKIRAEIKALSPKPTAYDVVDGNPIKDAVWEILVDVLAIIDKYKA